ncbi:hypothetical protein KJ632_00375 [Patescibacteria group bacterium]|nr:hypothetical protein [Patescibacteria group bacterium]
MKTKSLIKQALFVFVLMVGALSIVSFLPVASAALINPGDNPAVIAEQTGGESSLRSLVLTMVNYFLTFLGIIAVIMVIYGGVTYVLSAGNDEATGNAKKIIQYALVGLIIVLLSFAIVNTILGAGTGTET